MYYHINIAGQYYAMSPSKSPNSTTVAPPQSIIDMYHSENITEVAVFDHDTEQWTISTALPMQPGDFTIASASEAFNRAVSISVIKELSPDQLVALYTAADSVSLLFKLTKLIDMGPDTNMNYSEWEEYLVYMESNSVIDEDAKINLLSIASNHAI